MVAVGCQIPMRRIVLDCCLFECSLIARNGRQSSSCSKTKARPNGASLDLLANVLERRGALSGAPRVTSLTLVPVPTAEIASSSTSAEATASAGTRFLRLRFIDGQGPAVHLRAIQSGNGCLGLFRRGHLDEAEAA